MSRHSLAVAVLVLAAAAAGCAPQCTCPATAPAPATVPAPAGPIAVPTTPRPTAPAPAEGGPLRLLNEDEAENQMRAVYPARMAQAGVRGNAIVEVTLDETGTVQSARDVRVSNDAFRGPALSVAHALQFSVPPAAGTTVRVSLRWTTTNTYIEIVQP